MTFYLHGSGKIKSITYGTAKDDILQYIQQNHKYGHNVVFSLRNMERVGPHAEAPTQKASTNNDTDARKLEQDGYEIIFQAAVTRYSDQLTSLSQNMHKAYALISSTYCSKSIQKQVEEHPDFESSI